jgi:hypothetical protein
MKLAQRPLAHSASTAHVAPNTAPRPVPVLLDALLVAPLVLLDVVPLVLDVTLLLPLLPPWPLLLLAPVVAALLLLLALPPPPLVLSLPHPAVTIPIPMMTGIQRILCFSSSFRRDRLWGGRRGRRGEVAVYQR